MQDLKITLIQSKLHWQDAGANLAMFEEKIWQIQKETDLIVLPEMFTTGFSMEAEKLAEPMNFKAFKWMRQMAEQTKAVICGSCIIRDKQNYYNRLIWMTPEGRFDIYDKKHLFRMSREHDYYSPGTKKLIVTLKGWKICPMICYDLRFPAWSRNLYTKNAQLEYDLAIFVANWPASRSNAWDVLLRARAIENLSYVIGVNRVGKDGNGIDYNGHSAVISPKGEVIYFKLDVEEIHTTKLSAAALHDFRNKFPTYLDADGFKFDV